MADQHQFGGGGPVVERQTPERQVGGSKPTSALQGTLLPKSNGNTQEALAPYGSRHDWKIVD